MERKFYQSWIAMRFRCSSKTSGNTRKRYFERDIKVCEDWNDFEKYKADMWDSYCIHYSRHGPDTQLDRIGNDKGYSRKNCRWVTKKENCNNRHNRQVFKGQTLTEWAKELNIKRSTLAQRYYVYGWSLDRVLLKI